MIPISLAWLLTAWFFSRKKPDIPALQGRGAYLFAAVLANGIFYATRTRYVHVNLTGGGYSGRYQFALNNILASAFRWSGWLIHDFPYLIPLAGLLLIWILARKRLPHKTYILDALVWMAAWVGIFLPWIFTIEYYLLPFSIGCVVLCGLAVDLAVKEVFNFGKTGRALASAGLGLALVLQGFAVVNSASNARLQLTVDAANADMLAYVAQNTPPGGQLLINLPQGAEYSSEIGMHLAELYSRPDISWKVFDGQSIGNPSIGQSFVIISPEIKNQPSLTVRLGVSQYNSKTMQASLIKSLGENTTPSYVAQRTFTWVEIDFLHILCPFVKTRSFCTAPYHMINHDILTYRWNIYLPGR